MWETTTARWRGGSVDFPVEAMEVEVVVTLRLAATPPAGTAAARCGIFVIFITVVEVRLAEATGSAPARPSTGTSTAASSADSATARGCAPIRPAPVRSWRQRRPIAPWRTGSST